MSLQRPSFKKDYSHVPGDCRFEESCRIAFMKSKIVANGLLRSSRTFLKVLDTGFKMSHQSASLKARIDQVPQHVRFYENG